MKYIWLRLNDHVELQFAVDDVALQKWTGPIILNGFPISADKISVYPKGPYIKYKTQKAYSRKGELYQV